MAPYYIMAPYYYRGQSFLFATCNMVCYLHTVYYLIHAKASNGQVAPPRIMAPYYGSVPYMAPYYSMAPYYYTGQSFLFATCYMVCYLHTVYYSIHAKASNGQVAPPRIMAPYYGSVPYMAPYYIL